MSNAYNLVGGLVNFEQFKKLNMNKRTSNGNFTRDSLIANITKIENVVDKNGEELVRVEFGNHGKLGILLLDSYNARMKKLKGCWRGYGYTIRRTKKSGHILLNIQNVDLTLESMLLIIDDIKQDLMFTSYQGINANVMDGTGSLDNAYSFKPNMQIENLEWTLSIDNLRHGRQIRYLRRCCNGECYAYSAHDAHFLAMLELKSIYSASQIHTYAKKYLTRTYYNRR